MAGGHEFIADAHEFERKRVLVTGGTKGIGQAVVARLAEGGATVLTTARTPPSDPKKPHALILWPLCAELNLLLNSQSMSRYKASECKQHVAGERSVPFGCTNRKPVTTQSR